MLDLAKHPVSLPIFESLERMILDLSNLESDGELKVHLPKLQSLYITSKKPYPDIVSSIIKGCSKTLSSLRIYGCIKSLSVLSPLAKSQTLKTLILQLFTVKKEDMPFLESLPNLEMLHDLDCEDQSEPGWLDALFDSCGKTLKELRVICRGNQRPKALFRDGLALRKLDIGFHDRKIISLTAEELINLCKTKVHGFYLSSYQKLEIDVFNKIVKACPHIVFNPLGVKTPMTSTFSNTSHRFRTSENNFIK